MDEQQSSAERALHLYNCFRPLTPFLTTFGDPQKKHFFKHINDNLHKDMKINSLQGFYPTKCPPRPNKFISFSFHYFHIWLAGASEGGFLYSARRRFWQFLYRHISISWSSSQVPGHSIASWRDGSKRVDFGGREHGREHRRGILRIKPVVRWTKLPFGG